MSSMVMPKAEHNELLEKLLPELEGKKPAPDRKVRVVVSGHMCQAVKPDFLDLIEDMGAVVVDDDLYTGYRYVATDAEPSGDPLESLVRKYLSLSPPCPTRSIPAKGEDDWGQYLVEMTRRAQAQGVVILVVKFCEPHMMYYPHLREVLTAAGIPHLLLETEHEVVSLSGAKTRVQAFVEMLRARQGG
jgi:benzoyl-CoA reductase/2-hydroxyglutaryl-CoA dehydratase subunit BcrC/BadD/HgdB